MPRIIRIRRCMDPVPAEHDACAASLFVLQHVVSDTSWRLSLLLSI